MSECQSAHELHKIKKKIAVHMKDSTFFKKDTIFVAIFLLEFKPTCVVQLVHECTEIWPVKQYIAGTVKSALKRLVILSNNAKFLP